MHRLVLEAFVGPCPEGMQCRHLDGNRSNNHIDNLAWGTPKENCADRGRHGNDYIGEGNPNAKLKEKDIPVIRKLAQEGMYQREIGKKFGVGRRAIGAVLLGHKWMHVS